MRRDGMGLGQYVGILLDTCYDRRNAVEFVVNPLGGRMDGQITNESGWNQDWNPVWSVRVGRFDGGWTFQAGIPFKSLRYQPGRRQIRGINIERRVVWNNEYSALVPLPASWSYLAIMQVSQAATLVNLEVPIDAGGRPTGRIGKYSLGLLNISTYRAKTRTARVDVGDDFDDVEVGYRLGQQNRVSGRVAVLRGGFYGGTKTSLNFGLGSGFVGPRLELTPQLSIEPNLSLHWIDLPFGKFSTRLVGTRTIYALNPLMFVSALVQYNSATNSVNTNLRPRWEYHPGSELCVVYNEERASTLLAPRRYPLQSRALIVKFNRLFRF